MKNPSIDRPRPRGFALVITVSILVLLALVAVGLLSLSTVTVRTSTRGSAVVEARANARLALMLAIGDLQKQLGPDQRVSAKGDILTDGSVNHPHWTGVWSSWQAGDSDGPDQQSEHSTIRGKSDKGLHPTYVDNREDHFRSWLVSLKPEEAKSLSSPTDLALTGETDPPKGASAVELVSKGTLGPDSPADEFVQARLLTVTSSGTNPTGRYGWWIGDESLKARIMDDDFEINAPKTLAGAIFRHQSPGSTGTTTIRGLEGFENEEQLKGLPTMQTLGLVDGATEEAPRNFHSVTPWSYQVLADVREGGLKRDLSTLLERPINIRDSGDEYMLYRFDTKGQERVPIQDLAAYYQLYKDENQESSRTRKKGIDFQSRLVRQGVQISNPNFESGVTDFTREYTNLYRLPVPLKIQFLLSTTATPRTSQEKSSNRNNTDTHKLHIGITPSMTLWNPYNVPLIMNYGDAAKYATQMRFFNLPIAIRWDKNDGEYISSKGTSLAWITNGLNSGGDRDTGFTLFFSGQRPIRFEPGEVRVFSLGNSGLQSLNNSNVWKANREVTPGWNPDRFLKMTRSDQSTNAKHIEPPGNEKSRGSLTFSAGDRISFSIEPSEVTELANGSALQFFMRQSSVSKAKRWMDRHYQLTSRMGSRDNGIVKTKRFNAELMRRSFPDNDDDGRGDPVIEFPARSGSSIIRSPFEPFLLVNLVAGCEVHESSLGGANAGRHFPSRPFLHSSPITGTAFIDREDDDSFYHHGWNWWVEDLNGSLDAGIPASADNRGYYGGGYTVEAGTTHVVQQEIPVVPPISIAALSHAHLGGFSLANENLGPGASNTITAFQNTTASGQGGLFPHTLQAIGNSYAHPYIKPGEAFTSWRRQYSEDVRDRNITLADHSYLANKALWDEYFFSSISPRETEMFDGDKGDAESVAERFFFDGEPLANRRIVPYSANLDEDGLSDLFKNARDYRNGLADHIASHLLVEGPFNVNSTSVDAWKTFFSSLKGKPVSFLDKSKAIDGGLKFDEETPDDTPVASFSLPNGPPSQGSSSDPADPDQWTGWRELSDNDIEDLATAMVEQVRLRGPFLSLSEFVNRRLDSSDKDLALKGALQAALDDEQVAINEGFRDPARRFTPDELARMKPAFREALEGPVAYGSAAYIDQADILRNFGAQLTPRGDTFVIRTYGDSIDPSGNVKARAWCEAVVQRVPEYLDREDEAHLKQGELDSDTNKNLGRRLKIVSFRFLSEAEV